MSGGCVEGKVVEAAIAAMADREHRVLELGVTNDEAWDVGLACGGTVRILVEPVAGAGGKGPLGRETLARIAQARAARQAIVLLTPLDGSAVRTWMPEDPALSGDVATAAARALATDDATLALTEEDRPRRVVLVAEVDDVTEQPDSTVVSVDSAIAMRLVVAVHADTADLDLTAPLDPATLDDLGWFGVQEIGDLIADDDPGGDAAAGSRRG